MSEDHFPTLNIDQIHVPKNRARDFDKDWAEGLASIIASQGLFHPISVREEDGLFYIVSGLRRLEAVKLLNWTTIPCRISNVATNDDARLEEVMENLAREELIALDRCHHLFELKQVWERLYPHTAHGHNTGKQTPEGERPTWPLSEKPQEIFGFAQANAENLGLSQRTIRRAVAIWEGLSQLSRDRLTGTDLARKQTELKALSELDPKRQANVLDLILGDDEVTNVSGALQTLEGGVVPTQMEKQLTTLRKQVSALPEPVFDRLVLDNEDRIVAALKRQGRLE
ncbi:MAG: ParB N-terminal domain-containing protein [Pseudoruegeria sp.]